MLLDPRLTKIPKTLLELVGEELIRSRYILPCEDDGTQLTMLCPTHPEYGTFGQSTADRIGAKIGRKVQWIPIHRDIMVQAVDELYAAIDNCPAQFEFECPKTWHSLDTTDNEKIRYCTACQSNVYWCDRVSEARALAKEGKCVAISGNDDADDTNTSAILGMIAT
jgi:hypothetical protein